MELRHLRYFVAAAEDENITRAAARLKITQPGLSRQIKDLEEELGIPLFEHESRSVRLTEAGRFFLGEALDILLRLDDSVCRLRELGATDGKPYHVGYVPALAGGFIAAVMSEFSMLSPSRQVLLHDLPTSRMMDGLRDKSLDAAFLVKMAEESLEGLEFREIGRHLPCALVSSSHPLASRKGVEVGELAGFPLVAFERSGYPEHHIWLARIFSESGRVRICAECDTCASLTFSVASGHGIALVQRGFSGCGDADVKEIPLIGADHHAFAFGIACREADSTAATRDFLKLSIHHARERKVRTLEAVAGGRGAGFSDEWIA